jgi:HAD superfamily hydrolase (TIGR01450 family)
MTEGVDCNKKEVHVYAIIMDMDILELQAAETKRRALEGVRLFVLDMDGTFYLGDRVLPRSLAFTRRVREAGLRSLFFTNNSSRTPERYLEKLAGMGLPTSREDLLTSGDVAIEYLHAHHAGQSVYLLGTDALQQDFASRGIRIFESDEALKDDDQGGGSGDAEAGSGRCGARPDIVLAAFDTELTFAKLERACTYIRAGALFLATHPDINCPTEGGFIPDCGAFCAAITLSTGVTPRILGKPYPETIEMIEHVTGVPRAEIAFVGDRLYTDVKVGVNNGAKGFLVLTGETTLADLETADVCPNAVFQDLGDIADHL